jgi:high-affinity nickel-transport protein
MQDQITGNGLALMSLVFLLGMRHGMDADHLATIDGLTRFNAGIRPRISRWSGVLFSTGHGLVVTFAAILIGILAKRWSAPAWMDGFGTWVSILFLLALGGLNLANVLRTPSHEIVHLSGLKGRLLGGLGRASHPLVIVLVGALFALSFDTMSQAALFSLAAARINGWIFAALLGLVFMFGMMVTDGINGLWISRLLTRADRRARIASRVLGLTVAGLSLLVAVLGMLSYWSVDIASWSDNHGLASGVSVISLVLLSYLFSLWLTRAPLGSVRPLRQAVVSTPLDNLNR